MFTKKYNNPVLKKYAVASLLSLSSLSAMAADMSSATFTMLDGTGAYVGGATDVTGNIGDGAWAVASTTAFFGQTWAAHSGTTFGPGTYSFNTIQGGTYTGVTVGTGQVGGHILFNWGVTADIDVVNVWDVTGTSTATTTYTSTDVVSGDGTGANTPVNQGNGAPDGILGQGMIDGGFVAFNANFDFTVPTPPTATDDAINAAAGVLVNFDVRDNDTNYVGGATITGGVTPGVATIVTAGGTLTQLGDQTFSYTAASAGSYVFPYTIANDIDNLATATGTVTITVTNVPVAYASDFTTTAGVAKVISIGDLADTTGKGGAGGVIADDADGGTLKFGTIQSPTDLSGTVVVSTTSTTNDTLTYTPPANTNTAGGADDTFTITVIDSTGFESNTAIFSVGVDNAAPTPVADTAGSYPVPGNFVTKDVLLNDSDYEDGAAGTLVEGLNTGAIAVVTQGTYGTAVANGDGSITYTITSTPVADPQVDTFTYTLTDSDGLTSAEINVAVTISASGNTEPVAYDSDFNTDAGVAKAIKYDVLADTTGKGGAGGVVADDVDPQALTFVNIISPTANGGVITGIGSDTVTYAPADGFNGVDTFTFKVNDGIADSLVSATMTINVNNVLPVATNNPGVTMLLQDGIKNIDLSTFVSDLEDDINGVALTVTSLGAPDNGGSVVAAANTSVDYDPVAVGVETFTYKVTDSDSGESIAAATVTVTVTAAPVSLAVDEITAEDTPFSIDVTTVASDDDVGDTLTFDSKTDGLHGTVTISDHVTNGPKTILTYTPDADFNGVDSFTYTVFDGTNPSNTSTVNVTVTAVEDAMVCQDASFNTTVDTPLQITSDSLIGACTDVDGPVTLASYTQPAVTGSTVTDDGAGNLTYTPNAGLVGNDSFTFTASDGTATGDKIYTVSIAVIDDLSIHIINGGNFTMLDKTGGMVGGATDVTAVFDEKLICSNVACTDYAMTTPLASTQLFFEVPWTAHHIRVFGPGTYSIDTVQGPMLTFTVNEGQLGAHMLFDWGVSSDIDVAVVWNYNTAFGDPIYNTGAPAQTATKPWNWASIDGDGNGIRGIAMVDGPFVGFHANFNLDMTPGYTPPLANNDAASTTPGLLKTIDVIANDSDAEDGAPPAGATVTLLTATLAQGSTLTNNGDGTVDYTPAPALLDGATDSFQYTISDVGGAVSNVATVTIAITATLNTPPVANAVSLSVNEDAALTIDVTNSAVASDAESDPLTFTAAFDATSAKGGTVTINGPMTALTYTPQADFSGTDTFSFSVYDGMEDSDMAVMTITVNPVNDAPVCVDVTLATAVDTPLAIAVADLVVDCTDIEGDTVTFVSAAAPANTASTLVDDYAGTLTYTPELGLNGSDSFVFTATDGNGGNTTATAEILVGKVYGNFTMLDKQGNVFGGTNDVVFTWDGVSMHSAETDLASNMTIVSDGPHPFFGAPWFAHHVRVFGPGTYTFEADNKLCQSKTASPDAANASTKTIYGTAYDIDVTGCPGPDTPTATTMSMVVADGQVGVHMLFDYNGSFDIDVVNVYNLNAAWNDPTGQGDKLNDLWVGAAGASPDPTTDWGLVSTDVNLDGINGAPMVDGPFVGFYANFNDSPGGTAPPPAAITTTVRDTNVGGALSWLVLLGMLPLISLFRMRMK